MKKILIFGGGGYVGAELVYSLASKGYRVTVFDLFLYKYPLFEDIKEKITILKFDIRNTQEVKKAVKETDVIIYLSCLSNDPSFELNPKLSKIINYDAFLSIVDVCKKNPPERFIFASSSSVYGIKKEKNVVEDLKLEPLTDYSKYKVLCETALINNKEFNYVIIRPATVCGFSRRLRLDLSVNILTCHGYFNKKIKVFGGKQLRPNLHIKDMVRCYEELINSDTNIINKKIFNVGYENLSIMQIAEMVKKNIGEKTDIDITPSDDNRSYHISSKKIENELGFKPKFSIDDAIKDLINSFKNGKVSDPFNNPEYYNIKTIKQKNLN